MFFLLLSVCPLTASEPQPQRDLHSGLAAEGRFERRERGKIYCKTVSLRDVFSLSLSLDSPPPWFSSETEKIDAWSAHLYESLNLCAR